jgi:exodeoxyribonuclease III
MTALYDVRRNIDSMDSMKSTLTFDDVDTIRTIVASNTPEQKCLLASASREEFEELTQIPANNIMFIERIESKEKKRLGRTDVTFYITAKRGEENHIYMNSSQFWNIDFEFWDQTGRFFRYEQDKPKRKTRNVSIDVTMYKRRLFISESVLTTPERLRDLEELLVQFENGKRDTYVFIGALGKRDTRVQTMLRLKKKMKNIQSLEDRVIFYKNSQTFKDLLEKHNITHIIDDRSGYLKKGLMAREYVRKAYYLNKSEKHKHSYIRYFEEWKPLVEQLQEDVRKDVSSRKHIRPIEGHQTLPQHTTKGGRQKFVQWNTNSLRNVCQKGHFRSFVRDSDADYICITEARGTAEDILLHDEASRVLDEEGFVYKYFNHNTVNKGMGGTTLFSKIQPDTVTKGTGNLDEEGRVLTAEFAHFVLVTCYTPTLGIDMTNQTTTKNERRKLFDTTLKKHLETVRTKFGKPIILTGDLNCCHKKDDIWNTTYIDTDFPSCTKEERQDLEEINSDLGLVDSYEQGTLDKKHWVSPATDTKTNKKKRWTYFFNQNKTQGMRLDYFMIPKEWIDNTQTNTPHSLHQTFDEIK